MGWKKNQDIRFSGYTFLVENHSCYFKPALVVRLISVWGASKPPEYGGMCWGREDGEAGDLVVLQQLHVPLRVGVRHLDHHRRAVVKLDNLRTDLNAAHRVFPGPLCDPNHAAGIVFEGELALGPYGHLLGLSRPQVDVLKDGTGGERDPLLAVVAGTSLAVSLVVTPTSIVVPTSVILPSSSPATIIPLPVVVVPVSASRMGSGSGP